MSHQVRGNPLREINRENQKPKLKGTTNRRTVLGNVTNQVRKQPVRAAKDKHSFVLRTGCDQENELPAEGKKAAFSVFVDENVLPQPSSSSAPLLSQAQEPDSSQMEVEDKENLDHPPILRDSVIGLSINAALPRRPLIEPVPVDLEDIASPMAVDLDGERSAESNTRDEFGVETYIPAIYAYMRSKEAQYRPGQDYMNRQVDVSRSMRNILVDWLVEVAEEYKLHRETLFLAINYIDRFLSLVGVQRPKLQLVGAASMFIAAKFEEIYPPDVAEFVYITDDTYTKSQVLKMESVILKLLDFKVAVPTVNWFCEHFMENLNDMNESAKFLSFFLTELSLIEFEDFLDFDMSVVAASCVILARSAHGLSPWPQTLEQISGYSISDLLECVKALYALYARSRTMPQQAVVEKYKQDKFGRVALLPPPSLLAIH